MASFLWLALVLQSCNLVWSGGELPAKKQPGGMKGKPPIKVTDLLEEMGVDAGGVWWNASEAEVNETFWKLLAEEPTEKKEEGGQGTGEEKVEDKEGEKKSEDKPSGNEDQTKDDSEPSEAEMTSTSATIETSADDEALERINLNKTVDQESKDELIKSKTMSTCEPKFLIDGLAFVLHRNEQLPTPGSCRMEADMLDAAWDDFRFRCFKKSIELLPISAVAVAQQQLRKKCKQFGGDRLEMEALNFENVGVCVCKSGAHHLAPVPLLLLFCLVSLFTST